MNSKKKFYLYIFRPIMLRYLYMYITMIATVLFTIIVLKRANHIHTYFFYSYLLFTVEYQKFDSFTTRNDSV